MLAMTVMMITIIKNGDVADGDDVLTVTESGRITKWEGGTGLAGLK